METKTHKFVVYIFTLACFSKEISSNEQRNDLVISYSQRVILDKFKRIMSPIVPHHYMKEEIYLIRWLRAADFDLKAAEELLRINLIWRKKNRMDQILEEDFSDLESIFSPVRTDFFDVKGQVVVSNRIWNFLKINRLGLSERVVRYVNMICERASKLIREGHKYGQNGTRFNYLLDMKGFNLIQHACPACMVTYFHILRSYEHYWPEMIDNLVIINAPPTIWTLFDPLVRSVLSVTTMRSMNLKIFDTRKSMWFPYLLSFIDENELPIEFGGKRLSSSILTTFTNSID